LRAARDCLQTLVMGRVAGAQDTLRSRLDAGSIAQREVADFVTRLLCQVGEPTAMEQCRVVVADSSLSRRERDAAAMALCVGDDSHAVQNVIEASPSSRNGYRHLAIVLSHGDAAVRAASELIADPRIAIELRAGIAAMQVTANGNDRPALDLLASPT